MKHIALTLIGLLVLSTSCLAGNKMRPIVFHTLLIIKPSTDVTLGEKTIKSTMTTEDIAAVTRVYMEHAPKIVKTLTNGRVLWEPKVIVSKYPLTTLSYMKKGNAYWVGPKDVQKDIAEYVTPGTYDTFCIYYKPLLNDGNRPLPVISDFGLSPRATTNHAGMSSIQWKDPKTLTYETRNTEAFVHKWLQSLEGFYQTKGIKMPKEGSRSGLGEKAWAKGTIRDAAGRLTQKYMREQIKAGATNLLAGLPTKGQWRSESWKPVEYTKPKVVRFANSYSITMNNIKANDHRMIRSMELKPNTTYLFAATIQTVNLKIATATGLCGAAIEAGNQLSRSVTGNQRRQHVATEFMTGADGKADVILRIGAKKSFAKGSATFSDLRLIELSQ